MRIKSVFVIIGVVLIANIFLADSASAYSCTMKKVDDAYKSATVVFVGEIEGREAGARTYHFRVDEVFKGYLMQNVDISTDDPGIGSGVYMSKGGKYLVYAFGSVDNLRVYGCGRTKPLVRVNASEMDFLKERKIRLNKITDLIDSRFVRDVTLKEAAEELLAWKDYMGVEALLKRLYKSSSYKEWAYLRLLKVLYLHAKAQEIWELYAEKGRPDISWENAEYANHISFAAMVLGKSLEEGREIALNGAHLSGIDRRNQKLTGLRLQNVSINDSDFSGSRFTNNIIDGLRITSSNFSNANFEGMVASKVSFGGTELKNANFKGARISGLSLHWQTDITGADFQQAELENASFFRFDLKDANFSGAKILNGKLYFADFTEALLDGVSLEGSEFNCGTKWPAGFDPVAAGAKNKDICDLKERIVAHMPDYPASMESTEFVGVDFSGQDLKKRDFKGRNLKGANFSEADLKGVSFSLSDLTDTNFKWAKAGGITSFALAVLKNVNFQYGEFWQASFRETAIRDTSFQYANLRQSTFNDVDAQGQDFSFVYMPRAKLEDSNFQKANFFGADLELISVKGVDFSGANFREANLKGMHLNAPRACILPAGHCFQDPPWEKISIFKGADFTNAELRGADLRRGDFTGADFTGASLALASYDCETKWSEGFFPGKQGAILKDDTCQSGTPVDLSGLDLSGAKLADLNLKGADLRNTKLRGATLHHSDLSGAKLDGADMVTALFNCETIWPEEMSPIQEGAMLAPTDDEECLARYGKNSLRARNLQGASLRSYPLSNADLSGADLSDAAMYHADLFQADLSGANLRGTDLSQANLRQANLNGAEYDCNTKWSRGFSPQEFGALEDNNPCVKKERGALAGRKNLLGNWRLRHLRDTPQDETLVLEGLKLHTVNLPGGGLRNVVFKNTVLRRLPLYRLRLNTVDFIDCDLIEAHIGLGLDVNFKKSDLRKARIGGRHVRNVTFSQSDLRGVYIDGLNGENINFLDSDLRGSRVRGESIKNVSFAGSDLRGATIYGMGKDTNFNGVKYDCHTKGIPLPPVPCEEE